MDKSNYLRSLISHDGLKDSLTGLYSLPAFLESATREMKVAIRTGSNLNLFLVSLAEVTEVKTNQLVMREGAELSEKTEAELDLLAGRVRVIAHVLREELREVDLIARYTFTEFLIMNIGDISGVKERIESIVREYRALVFGLEITPRRSNSSEDVPTLANLISNLEERAQASL